MDYSFLSLGFYMTIGIIFQPGAFWIGAHYSTYEKRLCINIIPFLTIWFAKEGGNVPKKKSLFQFKF